MRMTVNVGMETSKNFGLVFQWNKRQIRTIAEALGFVVLIDKIEEVTYFSSVQGKEVTECTWVATLELMTHGKPWSYWYMENMLFRLASELRQDCIAMVPVNDQSGLNMSEGALYGPNASVWSAFDERYFKTF